MSDSLSFTHLSHFCWSFIYIIAKQSVITIYFALLFWDRHGYGHMIVNFWVTMDVDIMIVNFGVTMDVDI